MKNIVITILTIISTISLNAQGVLSIDEAIITPGPLNSVTNGGTGTFTFDIYEIVTRPVPYVEGQEAGISLTLTFISLEDGINSISGYEPYFDIAVNPYSSETNDQLIYFQQVQDIPADTYLKVTMNVVVREDSDATAPKNGGAVNLEPAGTQGASGADFTDIFTYTCYKSLNEYDEGSACSQLLPIELLRFDAIAGKSNVRLEWETATELNNSHFEIQRSWDGRHYEVIGQVAGQGTSSEIVAYEFRDDQPLYGTSYYRLKQVDFDGSFEYSPVNQVNFGGNSDLTIYPNPAASGTEIKIRGKNIRQVRIYNIVGQLMLHKDYERPLDEIQLSSSKLPKGIYITRINNAIEKRLVIN